MIATSFFYLSAFLLGFTYVGYPLLLFLLKVFFNKPILQSNFTPRVSFIVIAHNEEKYIASKIQNTLDLDYPNENIELLIGLDGCTDRTESLAREFKSSRVRVLTYNDHPGKYATRHLAVNESQGDILVFSDANALLENKALRNLLKNFSDPRVGAVCGNLIYRSSGSSVSKGEILFKIYDNWLKELESGTGSTILVEGSLCAVRQELYPPNDATSTTDLTIPMNVIRAGKKVTFEKEACSTEIFDLPKWDEIQRRANITNLTLNTLARNKGFLNPFRYGLFSIKLWFHRILLLLSPLLLLILLVSNACLAPEHPAWAWFFLFQSIFYLCAVLLPNGLFSYFYFSQVAILRGFWQYFKKKDAARWKPIRSATMSVKEI